MNKPKGARLLTWFCTDNNQIIAASASSVADVAQRDGLWYVTLFNTRDGEQEAMDVAWVVDDGYGNVSLEEVST